MSKLKIGIIGAGGRIRGVVNRVLQNSFGRVSVHGIFDPDERSIESNKRFYGDDITVYDSYQALAADPEIDWVFIGSWNCFHCEHAIAAFENGKDVFCEKPLATNLADCVSMCEAWKKSGRKFIIGFTLRFSPHYRKIKELLDAGEIGDIISMEFNETLGFNHGGYIHGDWRRKTEWAGTHLLEKCCHDIDLVNWFVGSKAKQVASFGGTDYFLPKNVGEIERLGTNSAGKEAFRTWPGLINENPFTADKDIIDNQVAIVEFENNVRTTFHTNCCTALPERRMYICGTRGTLRADVIPGKIELQKTGFDTQVEHIEAGARGGHGGGDSILGREIADCMLKGTDCSSTLEDGLRSAITAFGIDLAMAKGAVVEMSSLWKEAGL